MPPQQPVNDNVSVFSAELEPFKVLGNNVRYEHITYLPNLYNTVCCILFLKITLSSIPSN